jgi:hypothetical protein
VLTHPPGSLYLQRGLLHFLQAEAVYFRAHRRDVRTWRRPLTILLMLLVSHRGVNRINTKSID